MRKLVLLAPLLAFPLLDCVGDDPTSGTSAPDAGGDSGDVTATDGGGGPTDAANDTGADATVDAGPPAPVGKIDWATTFGAAASGVKTAVDASGNVYAAVTFNGTNVAFGGTMLSSTGLDIAVVKMNATGMVTWARAISGPGDEQTFALSVDGGDVYVAGLFTGASVSAAPSKTASATAYKYNGFVTKLSAATGDAAWMTALAPSSDSDTGVFSRWISVDARGGKAAFCFDYAGTLGSDTVAMTSTLVGTLNPTTGATTTLQVLRSSTNTQRIRCMGGVKIASNGSIFVAGNTQATQMYAVHGAADIANSTGKGDRSGFVVKLTSAGAPTWTRIFGSTTTPPNNATPGGTIFSMAVDGADDLYGAGYFAFSDFGTGDLTSLGGGIADDDFVVKLDSAGLTSWVKQIGGSDAEGPAAVTVDPWGEPIVAAYSGGGGSIDTKSFGSGTCIYVTKLSPVDGKALYVTGRSSGGYVNFGGIAASPSGYAVVGGNFSSALTLVTDTNATTSNDAFVAGFTP